ncbi:aromatase/cyclase [Amycolatopsis circi]|uniref:aromatase/cyclase n=1 Tax=Amycolatopsis circi TaxID=871959 RepID=UPI001ABFBCCD|nr:aromatase/cyclase [Amycolatopsis circi]
MPEEEWQTSVHAETIGAPADRIFATINDVENWPLVFPPMVHVEKLRGGEAGEKFQVWATAGDQVKTWVTGRTTEPGSTAVRFAQETSPPPLAAMDSDWSVEPGPGRSTVRIRHEYRALTDDAESLAWIARVVGENSAHELSALKAVAEQSGEDGLSLSFEDSVVIGGSRADTYAFIRDARDWPSRLPHVDRVDIAEPVPDVQILEMDTTAKDGSAHTTRSVRICFGERKIAYKQQVLPALLSAHVGCWFFDDVESGVRVTSRHAVVIDPRAVEPVLGAGATIGKAREFAQAALSGNSQITLGLAKEFAERAAKARS